MDEPASDDADLFTSLGGGAARNHPIRPRGRPLDNPRSEVGSTPGGRSTGPTGAVAIPAYHRRINMRRLKRILAGTGLAGFTPNWAAVGALAGLAAAFVAFMAYAWPRTPPPAPPVQRPDAASSRSGPVVPEQPGSAAATTRPATPEVTTSPPRPPETPDSRPPLSVPSLSVPSLLPAGCEEALAVIDRYQRTAGSTRLSQQAAATEAYQDMMGASLVAEGAVRTVTVALAQDFSEMRFILSGTVSGDYAAVQARTNRDAQTLREVCRPPDN